MMIVPSVIPRFGTLVHRPTPPLSRDGAPPADVWVKSQPALIVPKLQAASLAPPLVHHSGLPLTPLHAVHALATGALSSESHALATGALSSDSQAVHVLASGAASPVPRAILPDGRAVPPDSYEGGYHGTTAVPPEVAMRDGLPARGDDWRLQEHAEQHSHSAFRGTTLFPTDPMGENGAAYWAGEGGWVYEIRGVPTWDVNAQLEGRVKTLDGHFRGNTMFGENERAIPARVPMENIRRFGRVDHDGSGHLCVHHWIQNPAYHEA